MIGTRRYRALEMHFMPVVSCVRGYSQDVAKIYHLLHKATIGICVIVVNRNVVSMLVFRFS